jgi:hypothetical protein
LSQQRPELANEISLDIDPRSGLRLGQQWKGQLFRSNSRCESVIFVWPPSTDPGRAPYRGRVPFEDIDAGEFFGRDAAIARG